MSLLSRSIVQINSLLTQRDLEAASGKLHCEIATVTEQNSSLRERVNMLEASILDLKQAAITSKTEHDSAIKHQEESHQVEFGLEMERTKRAEEDLQRSREAGQAMVARINDISERLEETKTQLHEAQSASSATVAETDTEMTELRLQVEKLTQTNNELQERSKTIESRYRAGDLVRSSTIVARPSTIH